jgi:hypothetical protein
MEGKMDNKNIKTEVSIQGKVAGILTERELVINIGASHGVREGMKFKILANQPYEVRDPETNEKLGVVDREKVRVIATQVLEKFSICKTYRKRLTPGIGFPNFAYLLASSREVDETLKVQDSSLPSPLSEEESYVKVGDRVIELTNENDE